MAMIRVQPHRPGLEFVRTSLAFRNTRESILRDLVSAVKMYAMRATAMIAQGNVDPVAEGGAHYRAGDRSAVRPGCDGLPIRDLERGFDDR
jgi:hypothetical protein